MITRTISSEMHLSAVANEYLSDADEHSILALEWEVR